MVELVPHSGINVVTKEEQYYEMYRVYEGHPDKLQMVGFLDWKKGSSVAFIVTVDPLRKERILFEIQRKLEIDDTISGNDLVELPEDNTAQNEETHYEFDESDFS